MWISYTDSPKPGKQFGIGFQLRKYSRKKKQIKKAKFLNKLKNITKQ
jgi:hypothetical protein